MFYKVDGGMDYVDNAVAIYVELTDIVAFKVVKGQGDNIYYLCIYFDTYNDEANKSAHICFESYEKAQEEADKLCAAISKR